jgi:hypothetical protein
VAGPLREKPPEAGSPGTTVWTGDITDRCSGT